MSTEQGAWLGQRLTRRRFDSSTDLTWGQGARLRASDPPLRSPIKFTAASWMALLMTKRHNFP
eukprot:4263262-Pyramimonas_sp.AAC.1